MSIKDWTRLIGLSLLWGGSFFFVEIAVRGLPALSIVWGRVALGALCLALMLRLSGAGLPRGAAEWRALLGMGLLNNVIPFTLFVLAQGQISGAMAAILNATTPLWGVALAHVFTADKITPRKASGLLAGFCGVVVMIGGAAQGDLWAGLACLGAAFSYGVAGVWGRRFRSLRVAPLQAAFGQVACAAVLITPLWLWLDQPWRLAVPEAEVVGALVGIAVLSTALAYLIYFRLLESAGAANVLLVTFLVPVSAVALGVIFLAEALAWRQVAGFALIASGLAALDGRVRLWR